MRHFCIYVVIRYRNNTVCVFYSTSVALHAMHVCNFRVRKSPYSFATHSLRSFFARQRLGRRQVYVRRLRTSLCSPANIVTLLLLHRFFSQMKTNAFLNRRLCAVSNAGYIVLFENSSQLTTIQALKIGQSLSWAQSR